jgi:hypothetical protein
LCPIGRGAFNRIGQQRYPDAPQSIFGHYQPLAP